MASVTIKAYPRIHITLLSMCEYGYRKNGGIGFAIDKPTSQIFVQAVKDRFSITDNRSVPIDGEELAKLSHVLSKIKDEFKLPFYANLTIHGHSRAHIGLGTGTAITLAAVEGLFLVNETSVDRGTMVRSSGRGGASGIGINTYFDGGFVFDLGVTADGLPFESSDSVRKVSKSPLIAGQLQMPDWPIGICIPNGINPLTLAEEFEFFSTNCPIEASFVYEATYHALFGTYSAAKEVDRSIFCKSITEIQKCKWKALERSLHGEALLRIESSLYAAGAHCVGMSSLGPTLFFLMDDPGSTISMAKASLESCDIFIARPQNNGRAVLYA